MQCSLKYETYVKDDDESGKSPDVCVSEPGDQLDLGADVRVGGADEAGDVTSKRQR